MLEHRQPDLQVVLQRSGLDFHVAHHAARGETRLNAILMHGFSAHVGLYWHVAAALSDHGIAVTQFDSRGHGKSGGRRGHVDDFVDYLDDLAMVIAWARQRNTGLPWVLVGHSLGGAIVSSYVLDEKRTEKPSRLVLAAPWFKLKMPVPAPKRMAANVVAKVCPTLSMDNGLRADNISRNPEVRAGFNTDPLVHHVASAGWFMTTLRTQAHIRTHAADLKIPTLMLLACEDKIVANEASETFASDAGSIVEVRHYDGLYHELYLEPEAETVVTDIRDWLLSSLAPEKQSA
jgi:alpha-beta hydrolase superfamily lysophospholipase